MLGHRQEKTSKLGGPIVTRKKEREKTDEFLTAGQADRSGVEAIRTQIHPDGGPGSRVSD